MLIDPHRPLPSAPAGTGRGDAVGWLGRRLSAYLAKPRRSRGNVAATPARRLLECVRPGDVLLVEGKSRFSTAIKYLTQSPWSHAALYVGALAGEAHGFVEADIEDGVRAVGVAEFDGLHCRVCRPLGLCEADIARVLSFAIERIGHRYDLRNVIDLARHLLPAPPLPARWCRNAPTLGSGDPTRAICSTLIAQAFATVRYPILPEQHYSLCVPRDFDVSPYFAVVKPAITVVDRPAAGHERGALDAPLPPAALAA